jgi:hypothetical protein
MIERRALLFARSPSDRGHAVAGAAAIACVPVLQQQRHQHSRVDSGAEGMALPCRKNHQLSRGKPSDTAGHSYLHIAFDALNGALVVDVMLRLVSACGQDEVQQLQTLRLQQAGAGGFVHGRAKGADADDVERLGMW